MDTDPQQPLQKSPGDRRDGSGVTGSSQSWEEAKVAWDSPAACPSGEHHPMVDDSPTVSPALSLKPTSGGQPGWMGSRTVMAVPQPSKEPLPLFLRLRGKADLLWGWVILLAR